MKVALIAWPVCLLALSFSSYAKLVYNTQSSYKIHILKEGETLSGLLQKENHNPLYGKDRWVEKVLEANHLTLAQAKSLKKGMPVILPATAFEKDAVGLRQAAIIKHGLVGNRISKHQKATLGFQYHINNLQTSETSLSSAENYGLFLGYEDENHRVWRGLLFRPELEAGVLTHGTNRSQRREVVSYGPSFKLDTRISFRAPSSSASFGPTLGWESSSRALSSDEQLEVRRDHLLWSGVFVSKRVKTASNINLVLEANLQKPVYEEEIHGHESLGALKNEMSFEINLTKNYFLKIFSSFENYQNKAVENASATGARLTYLIQ